MSHRVPVACVAVAAGRAVCAPAGPPRPPPAAPAPPPERPRPAVAELFEDDAAFLVRNLAHEHSYPGEAHAEAADVYSGRRSIKIIPMQRQSPAVPGWAFRVAERPGPGEFRYLRFAW